MSKRIAQALGEPEQLVTKLVYKLEKSNGHPSHDARFIAENIQKVRSKITDLGLDPDDTTGEELYHALLVKFEKNSQAFDAYFAAENLEFDQKMVKATEMVTQNLELPQRWALKNKAAKAILRDHQPKRVMKYLHYRSLESMFKREELCEIFLAAQILESATWQKTQTNLISKLDQTNFELRPVKLSSLNYQKWLETGISGDYVVRDNSIAVFSLWPSEELKNAPLLTFIVLVTEELGNYGDVKIGNALARMSDMAEWWADMDHLIANLSSEHVSLSLSDCALNSLLGKSYKARSLKHGRFSFWHELVNRYQNLPELDGAFDSRVKARIAELKLAAPEPAYEFTEDF